MRIQGHKQMQALWDAVGGRVVQIHSSKRTDRRDMIRIWTRAHNVAPPQHFEAIMKSPGMEGCFLSHRGVASAMVAPYLVLEDDALPTLALHDTQHVFHVLKAIESQDFDIVYLGGLPAAARVLPTKFPGVLEGRCGATFAMVVSPRAAAKLRTHAFQGVPVDVELVRDKSLRTAFVHPPLFIMAETRSDIGKNEFNKSESFSRILSRVAPIWRWTVVWQRELFATVLVFALVAVVWKQKR
jgi:GR25 family glycosyltransferase involved in LPS biosynthesis